MQAPKNLLCSVNILPTYRLLRLAIKHSLLYINKLSSVEMQRCREGLHTHMIPKQCPFSSACKISCTNFITKYFRFTKGKESPSTQLHIWNITNEAQAPLTPSLITTSSWPLEVTAILNIMWYIILSMGCHTNSLPGHQVLISCPSSTSNHYHFSPKPFIQHTLNAYSEPGTITTVF